MANREKGGRSVFVGNIPYGVSEEQVMDIFSRAGHVVNFRLVYDKETGQPKGYGFLEYTDPDAAASAVRNLNEFELNGRTLRVDYSNDNRSTNHSHQNQNQNQDGGRAPPPAHFNVNGQPPAPPRPDPSALPPLPPGVDLPPGITAYDSISRTMSAVPTPQLIDFISQLKGLCASNPGQAVALLTQAPQLAYATFQAMLLLDLVDASLVSQLVATVPQATQPPAPPQPNPPMPLQGMPPYPPHPQGYPPQAQPPMPPMPQGYPPGYGPQPGFAPTPPQQPVYKPPPTASAPPAAAPPGLDPALYSQLAALPWENVWAIADQSQREQIANLKRYVEAQGAQG